MTGSDEVGSAVPGRAAADVVVVGSANLDLVLAVSALPRAGETVLADDRANHAGGKGLNQAVAAARAGARTAFVGAVGDDPIGDSIRTGLEEEGVDVSELAVVRGARSPQSSILVRGRNRAIVAFAGTVPPLVLTARGRRLCRAAAWVHVDHVGYAAASRETRLSIDGGNPIEGLELDGVALYSPTESTLVERFGGAELVVVTLGERGSVAYPSDGAVVEAPAHPVEPLVSTLGAGDVFHGALLAQLVRDVPLPEALAFANTCAALSCRALDGRSAIPTTEEVAA